MLLLVIPSSRPFNVKKHFFGFAAGLSSYKKATVFINNRHKKTAVKRLVFEQPFWLVG
jgi:hypothetical protein